MKRLTLLLAAGLCLGAAFCRAQDPPPHTPVHVNSVKIKPIEPADDSEPPSSDVGLIDVPTAGVLDYGGYLSQSRFYTNGGALQYVSFGVFSGLNIGASLSVDGLVGTNNYVHVRDPEPQIKYRFYEGTARLPALAIGYDGQGYDYNQVAKGYNNHRRGLYLVGTEDVLLPGLQVHPSVSLSDFNSSSFSGSIPVSYDIKDKALLMAEWDNINNYVDSRFNAGIRFYLTSHFHLDAAVRAIGQGGRYSDGTARGPERIVQLWYVSSF